MRRRNLAFLLLLLGAGCSSSVPLTTATAPGAAEQNSVQPSADQGSQSAHMTTLVKYHVPGMS